MVDLYHIFFLIVVLFPDLLKQYNNLNFLIEDKEKELINHAKPKDCTFLQ